MVTHETHLSIQKQTLENNVAHDWIINLTCIIAHTYGVNELFNYYAYNSFTIISFEV